MPLSDSQRQTARRMLAAASDNYLRLPLWDFHPYYRPLILSERRRRFGVPTQEDFDPEYH